MAIVPRTQTTRIGDTLTAAMARIDGCPTACGNTEHPRAAIPHSGGWVTSYACSDCSHTWTTSWSDA
jgi:hypothetical protein